MQKLINNRPFMDQLFCHTNKDTVGLILNKMLLLKKGSEFQKPDNHTLTVQLHIYTSQAQKNGPKASQIPAEASAWKMV